MTDEMSTGERVAYYRRRRGLTQVVVAGLVGRTANWLRRVEHDLIPLDRVSVIQSLAVALDVSLGDLLGEPTLMEWTEDSGRQTVPALRAALMDHRQFLVTGRPVCEPLPLLTMADQVGGAWADYQQSRYSRLTRRLPDLVTEAVAATRAGLADNDRLRAHELLASVYQLSAAFSTKLGETDLACIAATKGLTAADASENVLMVGSLYRSVAHTLLSIGEYRQAALLARATADRLQPGIGSASAQYLSVYGMLHLVGSVAAARNNDRADAGQFLAEASAAAQRLGGDANHLWTAFGPTNVAIHRVTAAMELGDLQVAVDLGPRIDTSRLPVERRVRHAIETARALAKWNRVDDALDTVLEAERLAPEQVRYHQLSRMLVRDLLRRPRPATRVLDLAQRMGLRSTRP